MVPPFSDRITRVPPYSKIDDVFTSTGLSPSIANFPKLFLLFYIDHKPGPRSLATTNGVSVDFLSSGYLDVSVPQVRFTYPMNSGMDTTDVVGFPIRTSTGQRLLASHRSFSQPITSFIASQCQGIHHMLLIRLIHMSKDTYSQRKIVRLKN